MGLSFADVRNVRKEKNCVYSIQCTAPNSECPTAAAAVCSARWQRLARRLLLKGARLAAFCRCSMLTTHLANIIVHHLRHPCRALMSGVSKLGHVVVELCVQDFKNRLIRLPPRLLYK